MYDNLYATVAAETTHDEYVQARYDYTHSDTYDGFMPEYLQTPEAFVLNKWRTVLLDRIKHDFGLEKPEPLCKNKKVPREGIVVRWNDGSQRALKIKSEAHYALAQKSIDKGEADPEDLA